MAMFNSEMLVSQRVMLASFQNKPMWVFFNPTTTLIDTVNPTYFHKPKSYVYYDISIYIYIYIYIYNM